MGSKPDKTLKRKNNLFRICGLGLVGFMVWGISGLNIGLVIDNVWLDGLEDGVGLRRLYRA